MRSCLWKLFIAENPMKKMPPRVAGQCETPGSAQLFIVSPHSYNFNDFLVV